MAAYGSPVRTSEYNGKCLIINGVELNGNRYDIRIERQDSGEIADLAAIKKFSIELFKGILNPSKVQFQYTEKPEKLESISEGVVTQCPSLVKTARAIHSLLVTSPIIPLPIGEKERLYLEEFKNDPKTQIEYAKLSEEQRAKVSFDSWCRRCVMERIKNSLH